MEGPRSRMLVPVMIEIPKGTRNKYEYDEALGRIRFDRLLSSPVHYPSDYGFIMDSLGGDGDPLDALVLLWEPTFPGCIIEASPVGVFRMADEKGPDEKILCVPLTDPVWSQIRELDQVPAHLLKEIQHFFSMYKDLEGKTTTVEGWDDRPAAEQVIRDAWRRHQSRARRYHLPER